MSLDDGAGKRAREELFEIRGRWQKDRARLLDRHLGLPTLAAVIDDTRQLLEERGSVWLLIFLLGEHGEIEQVWGADAYEDFLRDFVQRFKALRDSGVLPSGTLCLPGVLADELLLLVPAEGRSGEDRQMQDKADEIDVFIDRALAQRTHAGRFRSRVGVARLVADPRIRTERIIYRGLRDAIWDADQRTRGVTSRAMEVLKGVLASRSVTLTFQPIFDLATGAALGVEALARGPEGTDLETGESLFTLAESAGLTRPLERLCRERTFELVGSLEQGCKLFLNISPATAGSPDFLGAQFPDEIRMAGLEPNRVVLEITERNFSHYPTLLRDALAALRDRGFGLAVDDMGSGYSNLSVLAELAPAYVKFDHLFVRGIHEHQGRRDLLEALLKFAERTGTRVIAEGVETVEELDVLREMRVPYGQGYYLARPMPLEHLARFGLLDAGDGRSAADLPRT
jgi:EAL domain-containing protein (putative c-di-GMP-specific phosphodiesterase class I)